MYIISSPVGLGSVWDGCSVNGREFTYVIEMEFQKDYHIFASFIIRNLTKLKNTKILQIQDGNAVVIEILTIHKFSIKIVRSELRRPQKRVI